MTITDESYAIQAQIKKLAADLDPRLVWDAVKEIIKENSTDELLEGIPIGEIEQYAIQNGACIIPTEGYELMLDEDQMKTLRDFILSTNPPLGHPMWTLYEEANQTF